MDPRPPLLFMPLFILLGHAVATSPAVADRYLGAFIQEDGKYRGDVPAFERDIGAPLSFYATYRAYGRPFPADWAQEMARQGRGLLIFWEPWEYGKPLPQITEDAYLRRWAATLSRYQTPTLLVFGSEPNMDQDGYPVPYEDFRSRFRLVSTIMRRMAPRVEMVFSLAVPGVISAPRCSELYFPGPEFVDWVAFTSYDNGDAGAWERLEWCLDWAARLWPEARVGITEIGCERQASGAGRRYEAFLRHRLDAHPRLGFMSYFSYDAARRERDPKPVSYGLRTGSEAMEALRWAAQGGRFRPGPPPPNLGPGRPAYDGDPYVLRGEALAALYEALPADMIGRPHGLAADVGEASRWLAGAGIIEGHPDGGYRTGEAIIGLEAVLLAARAAAVCGPRERSTSLLPVGYDPERFPVSKTVRKALGELEVRGVLRPEVGAELRLFDAVHKTTLAELLAILN